VPNPDDLPGPVELVREKSGACRAGVEMVIVVPFSGHEARPDLVDGLVFAVEVDAVFAFVDATTVSVIVVGAHAEGQISVISVPMLDRAWPTNPPSVVGGSPKLISDGKPNRKSTKGIAKIGVENNQALTKPIPFERRK